MAYLTWHLSLSDSQVLKLCYYLEHYGLRSLFCIGWYLYFRTFYKLRKLRREYEEHKRVSIRNPMLDL
jgi:hypothetical protein